MTSSVVPMRADRADRADPVWRDRSILALAYTLAWGLLLVNRGLYWDDWTLVGRSPASLVEGFAELGMPWVGYLHAAVLATPAPGLVGHILTFVVYLLSTLVLHAVLRRVPGLTRLDALVAALTFAVLPVNFARVAVIDLPYGLSLLAFLTATWFLFRYLEVGGLARRLAALALYIASFSTASLLLLYVVPIGIAGLIAWRPGRGPIWSFALRYADFIVLPVAFWLLKGVFFPASGVYEGYNALSLRGLLEVPPALVAIPWQVLGEPLYRAAMAAGLAGVAAGGVIAVWLWRRSRTEVDSTTATPAPVLALAGVIVLVLGVFAYLAVGRVPTIWDWSSRHQLLVPLGAGLLAAAGVRGLRGRAPVGRAIGVAVALLLGVSVVADARTLVDYQLDWYKQTALTQAARTIPEMRTARHIRVVDAATELDAMRRTYRFYEYNALFSQALGDTRRLAAGEAGEPREEDLALFIARPAYHMSQYVPGPIDLELQISTGARSAGALDALRLLLLEAVGSPSFESEVARLIDVDATPVGSAPSP